jgi:hypothetical protein
MNQHAGAVRKAFLCEVYQQTQGDTIKAVSYKQIVDTLKNFDEDALEQACYYLEGHVKFVHTFSGLSPVHIIRPDGRTVERLPSKPGKLVAITDAGIAHVREHYQS